MRQFYWTRKIYMHGLIDKKIITWSQNITQLGMCNTNKLTCCCKREMWLTITLKLATQAFSLECVTKSIFLFLNQNICCGYSKEPFRWDGSFEHPKRMLKLLCKKLEDLKVLRRSPDLLNNVKIGQGQVQLIMEQILFYHIWGLQTFWSSDLNNLMNNPSNSPVTSEKEMFR